MNEHFIYQDQLHGESFTPILDSLVPPDSGDTTLESVRAIALTTAHATAQSHVMNELGEVPQEVCDQLKNHLDQNIALFMDDINLLHGGVLYSEQGEMFDVAQLTNELIDAVYPQAKYAAIEALRAKAATIEASLLKTRTNIEMLSGIITQPATSILETIEPVSSEHNIAEDVIDSHEDDYLVEAPHSIKIEARFIGGAVLTLLSTSKHLIQKIAP